METTSPIQIIWPMIKASPTIVISSIAAIFGGGFFVGKLAYGSLYKLNKERLEASRDDLAKLEKENADLKSSGQTKIPDSAKQSNILIPTLRPVEKTQFANTFFLDQPHTDIASALQASKSSNKPLLMVIFDPAHPTHSKLNYSLGYFMEYNTTKKLVRDYFETAIVPSTDQDASGFVPEDDPLENCRLVSTDSKGHILHSEGVYANPDEGLKRIRSIIARIEAQGAV